jgi:hypothetical protein
LLRAQHSGLIGELADETARKTQALGIAGYSVFWLAAM